MLTKSAISLTEKFADLGQLVKSRFVRNRWRGGRFYEKVIKVKWPTWRPSVLVSYGTSSPHSLRLWFFGRFLYLVAFAHTSTEPFALGSLRSDGQLGRLTVPSFWSVLS